MSNIISNFQKLIKGGVGIRAGGLENFSKINKRGGTIIRYSRVDLFTIWRKRLRRARSIMTALATESSPFG